MIKISRSKIELFVECPSCFWLDVNKKIRRPPGFPYTINLAIDGLLKEQFDLHRKERTPHPLMVRNKIDAVPFDHPDINRWRTNFTGIQVVHKKTDFLVFGAVDDLWINPKEELHVVDYKSTGAENHNIYDSYQRQAEIYQWLLLNSGFRVSPTGYFLFAKVNKGNGFPEGKLSFDFFIESITGDSSWVDGILKEARECLEGDKPDGDPECEFCAFVENALTKRSVK